MKAAALVAAGIVIGAGLVVGTIYGTGRAVIDRDTARTVEELREAAKPENMRARFDKHLAAQKAK